MPACVTGSLFKGLQAWRQIWMPVILEGLGSADEHLRHRVSLYAVPVPLALDQASVLPVLQQVVQPPAEQPASSNSQVRFVPCSCCDAAVYN